MRVVYEGKDCIRIELEDRKEVLVINPIDDHIGKMSDKYDTVGVASTNVTHKGKDHYLGELTGRLSIGSFNVRYYNEGFGTYLLVEYNTKWVRYDAGVKDVETMISERKEWPQIGIAAMSLEHGLDQAVLLAQRLTPKQCFPMEAKTQQDGIDFARRVMSEGKSVPKFLHAEQAVIMS